MVIRVSAPVRNVRFRQSAVSSESFVSAQCKTDKLLVIIAYKPLKSVMFFLLFIKEFYYVYKTGVERLVVQE